MALMNRGRDELCSSPERTRVWMETTKKKKKVSVVYYLSRNGQLEQPHFMEVTLSSNEGLYLKDVISRLNFLRGNGMASMYSWSSKRSYKNGFVWNDLSENDFIYPANGQEYVLKGSEILHSSSTSPQENTERRKKTVDFGEYRVYKNKLMEADIGVKAMDVATQTDDAWRRQRRVGGVLGEENGEREKKGEVLVEEENPTTEISCDEVSPPPSSSSTETLESLIKGETSARVAATIDVGGGEDNDRSVTGCPSGRFRASAVLMNLISCGSISVKERVAGGGGGKFLPPRSRTTEHQEETKEMDSLIEMPSFSAMRLEDKEYFSGSLIDTKMRAAAAAGETAKGLQRSSSYNAERSSKEEINGSYGARCLPVGKSKAMAKGSRKMELGTK